MEYKFAYARSALKFGLKYLNKDENNIILIPDYICEDVIDPLKYNNLKHVYYKINDNLEPNWESIERNINKNVKYILMVHYFGKNQNIEKFKFIAKKYNLLLIEDNAHGYGGKYNNTFLGDFGDISISSPRKLYNIQSGGILKININNDFLLQKLPTYKPKKINLFRQQLNHFPKIKKYFKLYLKSRPKYEDIDYFRNSILKDYIIDNKSLEYLININFEKQRLLRYNEYIKWKNFAESNNLKPVFSNFEKDLIPWCFPAYVKDNNEAIKWFDWGWENDVNIFSWPTLPNEIVLNNKVSLNRWKKLICFSIKNN